VDPERIGIWGLSCGWLLTSQALARNSDIVKAGVDLSGVHLRGSSLDPEAVFYKSCTIGAIDGWRSPELLVHDDTHESMLHSRWMYTLGQTESFVTRFLELTRH
jgi:hypothetical protein